jgi:hypothetical protein
MRSTLESILRWTARTWSVASTVLLLAFTFGGREHLRLTTSEAVAFLFFPVGVVAGFVVGWRREFAGGLITVGSITLFYLYMFAWASSRPAGPYFLLFAAPGFIHLVNALFVARKPK